MEEVILNRVVETWLIREDIFNKLWAYKITLLQRPKDKSWRLWLNSEDTDWTMNILSYLIEQPTIKECIDRALDYIENWNV